MSKSCKESNRREAEDCGSLLNKNDVTTITLEITLGPDAGVMHSLYTDPLTNNFQISIPGT